MLNLLYFKFFWFEAFCGDAPNERLYVAKSYQTVYKCKKAHLKTRNRKRSILLLEKTIEKMTYEINILSFSKSNSQQRQSLCSFPKHNKVWIK